MDITSNLLIISLRLSSAYHIAHLREVVDRQNTFFQWRALEVKADFEWYPVPFAIEYTSHAISVITSASRQTFGNITAGTDYKGWYMVAAGSRTGNLDTYVTLGRISVGC